MDRHSGFCLPVRSRSAWSGNGDDTRSILSLPVFRICPGMARPENRVQEKQPERPVRGFAGQRDENQELRQLRETGAAFLRGGAAMPPLRSVLEHRAHGQQELAEDNLAGLPHALPERPADITRPEPPG